MKLYCYSNGIPVLPLRRDPAADSGNEFEVVIDLMIIVQWTLTIMDTLRIKVMKCPYY